MKFFTQKPETPSKEKVLDVKTLLKSARRYIDDNNIKKAQQCCKKILRKNNQHYTALVLLGKTYGKSDDAPISYEKAIDLKPDHPLAWQGLAHYYEGKESESAKIKLLNIYDKILSLNIEEDYATKILRKHGQLGCLLNSNGIISFFIQYMRVQDNENLKETAKKQLLQILKTKLTCKNEDIPDVIHILKNLNIDELNDEHSELILLGQLIFRNNDFISAVEYIVGLEAYSKSLIMKTWLCKLLCETFIKQNSFCGFDIDKYLNQLVMGVEDTKYGGILVAVTYYGRAMFEQAYQKCISAIKDNFDAIEELEAVFLINCTKMTPNRLRTINLCNYLFRKENLNDPHFIIAMNTVLLSCYIQEKDFYKSLCYLKKIPINKIDSIVLNDLGNLYLELEIMHDYTWEILDSTDYFDLFKAFACLKKKKYTDAVEILLLYDKHPLKYYYLALAYWFLKLNSESFENFQKAAQLIPYHPKVFYCLGIIYYRWKDDIEESKKCFEKSYSLCKTDVNVVKMLSIIYSRLGLMDLEFELLQTAFDIPKTRQFWVCTRLGRMCYSRGIMSDAIIYLQAAIDFHPEDIIAQELIGDVYFSKKDYNLALTAYNKVVELSQDSTVFFKCLNRIGCIYSEQKVYHKAIYIFDNILDNDPGNIAALKGMTENRLIFGLSQVASDLFHDAREQMQWAVNRITTAMAQGIKDLIYWSLYGDILVFLTRLPNEYSFLNLQTSEGEVRKDKIALYKMAIESYSNVIKFRDSSALFKCAVTYFEYYCETRNIIFCRTSYNLAVLYMKVNPNIWPVWDLLGKLCYHLDKCETAYYCFSKALCLSEENEFKSWCNLGVFYLKLDKHQLASYRHVIEQFDLSTFAPTWLKEDLSDTILNYNENSDFFDVEALNVDNVDNNEFTDWIRTLNPSPAQPNEPTYDSPLDSFKNVPNVSEITEWYLCLEEETAWSCSSLGNLQENKGLYIPALRYYDRAYFIAHDRLKNDMLSQKGRVLMKMEEYEEAINVYNRVLNKNLHDTCALANALFKVENYKKSYIAYDKAFNELCENDEQRVEVLIAKSNVACRLNGLFDGAMLLLQAVRIKCGEGENFTLPFMKSYVFKKVDIQLVNYIMTQYLYNDTDKSTWWYYAGLNFFRGINKYAKLTRACIKRAIRTNTLPCRNGKLFAFISVAEFYSGNKPKALSNATQALKFYPVQPELWAVFVLCIYADKTWPRKASFLRVVIDTVRRCVIVNQSLDKWLTKVEEDIIGIPKNFNFTFDNSP